MDRLRTPAPLPAVRRRLAIGLLLVAAGLPGAAQAGNGLENWRREVAATRHLADNNAPAAFGEANRLQAALPAEAGAADRALVLNLRARTEVYLGLTEPAAAHAENALQIARTNGDKIGQAEAHLNIALNSVNQGRIAANGKASSDALAILDGVDRPDLLGEAMLRASMMYRRNGQQETSVTLAIQSLDMARRSGHPLFLAYALQGMGIATEFSEHYVESEKYYREMLAQAGIAGAKRLEATALQGISTAESATGRIPDAEKHAREAVALFRATGTTFAVSNGLFRLADMLRRQGHGKEALALLDEVVEIYDRNPNQIGMWWALNTRSADHLALGQLGPATADAERAYALARDIGAPVYLTGSARQLAALAAAREDYRRAYTLSVEATETAARGERERASEHLEKLTERYQSEARQRQIEELTRQAYSHAQEQRWLWTVLAASLLLLAVTGGFLLRQRRTNRLLAELNAQVEQSSRKLQATLDAVPDLLFEIDLDGRIHDYHSPRTDLLLIPPEQLAGRTMAEILPPEAEETCMAALREADENGTSSGKQYALSLPQGTAWFELSVARKPHAPNRIPRFIVLARDITERKHTEHELLLLQRAINHSSDALFVKDIRTNRFVSVNDAACRSLGYSRSELLGMTPLDIDPDITAEAIAQSHETMEPDKPHMLETRHRSKDGRLFPVEITGAFFEDNGVHYAIAQVRNITARERIENTLRFIANPSGELNFLTALARHLGETLGAAYVVIDRLADEAAVAETVALYANGGIAPNMRYALADTPCNNVAGKRTCCYPSDVQALFPKDALLVDMGVESYAGVPLWDSTGRPIGLIAIMDDAPITDEAAVMQLLQIAAPRAAAELERARSDAQLHASEQAFRALVEHSPDNIVRYDLECRRIYANPTVLKLFDCPAEELLGKTPFEHSPFREAPRFVELLRHVIETGEEAIDEQPFRTLAGEMRWGHVRMVPEYGPDGAVAGVLAVGRDITDVKKNMQRFQALADNFPDLLLLFDSACRFTYANPVAANTFGVATEAVVGRRLDELGEGGGIKQDAELEEGIRHTFATGMPTEREAGWDTGQSKQIFEMRYIPEKDAAGKIVSVMGIGRNVTRLREAEQALRASEREFRTLAENSPNIIVRYDRQCRRLYVNPAYLEQTELTRDQAVSVLPDQNWRPDISMPVAEYKTTLRKVMTTGERTEMHLSWTKQKTGEVVHHALTFVPEYDLQGNIIGALAIGANITALKAAEYRLQESYDLLKELTSRRETAREEERKRIAREIHDELGQQLTALRLKVNLLNFQFGGHTPPLREATADLLGMVDNTIQVARNVATSLRPAALDMGIPPALDWLAGEFQRNTGIRCELGPMPADLPLDEEQSVVFFRIAQESLTNVARHAGASRVRISLDIAEGGPVLEIADDGVGFDPQAFRLHKFGLVGIRERALAVGGTADIDSLPGQGTRVRVSIPIVPEESPS